MDELEANDEQKTKPLNLVDVTFVETKLQEQESNEVRDGVEHLNDVEESHKLEGVLLICFVHSKHCW
jgi:hypothetical protein